MAEYIVKGQAFSSSFSNVEAITAIGGLFSEFARSLAAQYARKGSLSPLQWPWVHKLAVEAAAPPRERASCPVDCKSILVLFQAAQTSGMKRAKVSFPGLRFSLCGPASRYAGDVHVAEGTPEGKYFGRIGQDGKLLPGRDYADLDLATLESFSQDPIGYSAAHGRESGSCCFCSKGLTTKESVSAGYGPICAGRYNLPWGE